MLCSAARSILECSGGGHLDGGHSWHRQMASDLHLQSTASATQAYSFQQLKKILLPFACTVSNVHAGTHSKHSILTCAERCRRARLLVPPPLPAGAAASEAMAGCRPSFDGAASRSPPCRRARKGTMRVGIFFAAVLVACPNSICHRCPDNKLNTRCSSEDPMWEGLHPVNPPPSCSFSLPLTPGQPCGVSPACAHRELSCPAPAGETASNAQQRRYEGASGHEVLMSLQIVTRV